MNNYLCTDFTVLRSLVLFFCSVVSYFLRTSLLTNCHVLLSLLYIFLLSAHTTVLSIFIYAVTCAWSLLYSHMRQMCIYNCCCLSSLPPSDSLSLTSGYWSFMFPCLHYAWAPGDSNNHCTIYALWPVTIHVCLRHTTLGYVEHFHTNVKTRFVMSM